MVPQVLICRMLEVGTADLIETFIREYTFNIPVSVWSSAGDPGFQDVERPIL